MLGVKFVHDEINYSGVLKFENASKIAWARFFWIPALHLMKDLI